MLPTEGEGPAAVDVTCPVCGEPVGAAPTLCPTCATPHHWDCWEYNGGCAVYSCPRKVRRRRGGEDEAPPATVTALAPTIELPVVRGEFDWATLAPRDDFQLGFALAWFFATMLLVQAEKYAVVLVVMLVTAAAGVWRVLPTLLERSAFEVDFAAAAIRRRRNRTGRSAVTEIWCLFGDLDSVAVQWTSTSDGPRLELVATPRGGTARRLVAPFEPDGAEAEQVATVVAAFVTSTDVPVRGQGNLGNALRRALGQPLLPPM